jgi:hypothetical protein
MPRLVNAKNISEGKEPIPRQYKGFIPKGRNT